MIENNGELLAPGGGFEEVIAAFNAGADAVYTGLKSFSARKLAKNLDLEELDYLVKYAHMIDKKIYLAINTILYDYEIEELMSMMDDIVEKSPDGVIVQDIGLFNILNKVYPDLELHASTQMTADNLYAVKNLYSLGFKRVVLARELSIDEIKEIKNCIDVDLEVFIHGALCVSYSGDCYFSSAIGTRSANRGDCAQPCRKKYRLIVDGETSEKSGFYLSMKDLKSSTNLSNLVGFADSFKIEGRMKSKEYVYTITNYYRQILDSKFPSHDMEVSVSDAFSRGFTKGFLFNEEEGKLINENSPKHIGTFVGDVRNLDEKYYIEVKENLFKGDGLVFKDREGKSQGLKLEHDYKVGSKIELNLRNINCGKVYRNYSARLYRDLSNVHLPKKLPLEFTLKGRQGESLIIVACSENKCVEYKSDYKLQRAKKPQDYNIIFDQLSRVGDTFFENPKINVELEDNLFIPKSILNEVRRLAISDLIKTKTFSKENNFSIKKNLNKKKTTPKLCALVRSKQDLSKNFTYIATDIMDEDLFKYYSEKDFKTILITDSIASKNYCEEVRKFVKSRYVDSVEINNYGLIDLADTKLTIAGSGLNIMNSYAVDYISSLGIEIVVPSREISLVDILNLNNKTQSKIVLPYYTRTISMTNKAVHSDISTELENGKQVEIMDGKNEKFPIEYRRGTYLVYNSRPLFMAKKLDDINANIIKIEIDENINEVMNYLFGEVDFVNFEYTTGHYRRGV